MADKLPLTILFVEDEPDLRERIGIVLEMHFTRVLSAANGKEGVELFSREQPDLVVSDIRMPIMDGLALTQAVRERSPETPVILTTAFTDTAYLLKAIELGVSAYVRKPLDCRQLVETIARAATPILQRRELEIMRQREQSSLALLLGESPVMQEVIRQAQRIAQTTYSLVIQGETGVGKSYLAELIHGLSPRRQNPLVTVTVSALPESLAESHLFGHVRGAFTGAGGARKGLFEEADGGTLFLDDIDCATAAVQAKILHAVEQKRFLPVGGTKPVEVDVRIITASNRDLLEEARQGSFREDLYYRLSDLVITLPPLRERGEDIPLLARRFLNSIASELQRVPPRLPPEAVAQLNRHSWPGNLRELKSVMKRAVLFAEESITADELATALANQAVGSVAIGAPRTLEESKRQAIRQALAATNGRKMEAARLLELDYSTFKRMLDKYKL